ncbi:methyl-accepting chemotaxis protein [Bordetella sp. 2513F-2]
MRASFKVGTALNATLVGFVLCFAAACGATIWLLQQHRHTIEELGRANIERASDLSDLSSRLFQVRADLTDAKTYMEGGMEAERDEALARADALLQGAQASRARLAGNPATDPQGQPLYAEMMKAAEALETGVLVPLRAAVQGWNGIEANRLAGPALAQAGKRYVTAVEAYQNQVRAQGRAAVAQAARMQQQALAAALAMLAGVALLALLVRLAFQRRVLRPLNEAGRHFDRIADGDLTGAIASRSDNEIGVLYAAMRRMQAGLSRAVHAVRQGVEEIHAGSGEIAAAGAHMSERAARQAGALQDAAANLTQLAATVAANAEDAGHASREAEAAAQLARRGGVEVDGAVQTMHGIADASRRIAEIVAVVDGIAFQTNLLALNAGVEAARAGTHGRGFAVVAGEVRTLAQRSAQAAQQIKSLIDEAGGRVDAGARQIGRAGTTMQEVVQAVDRIAQLVAGISQASLRQADDVVAVERAVADLEGGTQENAAMVEQTAAGAGSLAEQAHGLREAVAVFRLAHEDGAASPARLGLAHDATGQGAPGRALVPMPAAS